jgi:glycosyltransferase involved in cell wall biosynthesis
VVWADAIVCWFGSMHALVPFLTGRLLGRRCLVIAGGYDVACEPAINYGNMRGGLKKAIGMLVFRLAHRVLAFSEHAGREVVTHAKVPSAKVEVITLGVADAPDGGPAVRTGDRRSVITVGVLNESNLARKGLRAFVQAARFLPDVPFVLVGGWTDRAVEQLRAIASPNVEFTGWVSDRELRARMEAAGAYVQVSYHEAFGVALAEAMLCGCVPVVTSRGSLPEVVGETGLYVPYGDPAATAEAIRSALSSPALGEAARQRIRTHFPPSLRHGKLLAALKRPANSASHH